MGRGSTGRRWTCAVPANDVCSVACGRDGGYALGLEAAAVDAHRFEALISCDRAAEAVADLRFAAMRQPLRDRTHRLLIEALHTSGRQAEALRVYQDFRRRLATDLGLEPSEDMRALEARVAADAPTGTAVARVADTRPVRGYLLGERLGDGAFAVVYRATRPAVGREVAVKVIRPELANRPTSVRLLDSASGSVLNTLALQSPIASGIVLPRPITALAVRPDGGLWIIGSNSAIDVAHLDLASGACFQGQRTRRRHQRAVQR